MKRQVVQVVDLNCGDFWYPSSWSCDCSRIGGLCDNCWNSIMWKMKNAGVSRVALFWDAHASKDGHSLRTETWGEGCSESRSSGYAVTHSVSALSYHPASEQLKGEEGGDETR